MKKNKINPLEAHFEKLILVAVSAVLLAVVAMQFLTQPNAVKVGTNPTPLAPDRVFDPIERDAEALLAQMQNSSPTLPEVPDQNVAVQFAEVSNLAVADSIRLTVIGEGVSLEAAEIGPSGADAVTTYVMPALPVPATLAAATHRATIDPYTAVTNTALRAYLPKEQPFDTVAVSVEGTISGETLLASLEQDPDGDSGPMSQLPLTWWRGNMELLGVEVEREELGTGGSWTGSTLISGVPGRDTLLSEARRDQITAAELVDVARSAQSFMRDIAQPSFPQTVAGPDWVRPSEMTEDAGLTDEERDIARLKRQYDSLLKRQDGIRLQMENLTGSSGGGEERGGGGSGRRGGGGEGGQPNPRPTVDRDQIRRDNFQKQIDALDGQLARLADQLADLGAPIDGTPDQNAQSNEPEPPLPSLLEAEDLPVWVHDFSAQPGKTYRYRMRVVVNNPLFAKEQFLSDAQKPAAASPTTEGEWSGWSSPISVERDRHFFVVSGSENDALGNGPRAAVEVYQFYYGYWRKGSTTLEPGDSIRAKAKLPDNLLLWDLAKLEELGPRTGTGGRPAPGAGWREGFEGGPEGGGDNRRLLNPDRDPRDPRQPAQPRNTADAQVELPEGATKAPDTLELVHAAMLLDVMPMPGGQDSTRVVLRDAQGQLIARLTDSERASQFYKRLTSNAREGETQGQPELEANNDRQTPPPFDPRRREGEIDPGRGPGGG
ncbi:MAG: hypothetical protein HND58_03250 [Planctomycetota bacterium]|nr:MAG: hypothetical protein HND58_03250 [Planctomycetota bacterium]